MPADNKQEEFLQLFEPVREPLSRFALALTRNRDDAHDLVAEAVLLAYESFEKLKKRESFKSYIFTIANRLYRKKKWRERIFGFFDENAAEQLTYHDTSADTRLDVQILYRSLEMLPEKQKEAVILFEISGFSLEEIRDVQGGTISGVKSRLKRGREKLAEIMNPSAGGASGNPAVGADAKGNGLPDSGNGYTQNGHPANGFSKTDRLVDNFNIVKNDYILRVKK